MWLQRVLFNIRARILGQGHQDETVQESRLATGDEEECPKTRRLQDKILAMDERLANMEGSS